MAIDPCSDWIQKNFPDAVDSADVGWMIVEWKIKYEPNKCKNCGGNYALVPNQFDEYPLSMQQGQANAKFRQSINNRRSHPGNKETDPRRRTLFLCKVIRVADITDDDRNLKPDVVRDV
jgi:hypothetical protein